MEEYRKAKALLFSISKKGVINLDDAAAEKMLADAKCPCMTFSCGKPEADPEDVYKRQNEYCEDTLKRTEEAVALGLEEVRKARQRFKSIAK